MNILGKVLEGVALAFVPELVLPPRRSPSPPRRRRSPSPPPRRRRSPSPPPPPPQEFVTAWRPVYWSKKEAILRDLDNLRPNLSNLRILLHGPIGAGKSCFINSVNRALLGRNAIGALEQSPYTQGSFGTSFTRTIKTHKMKKHGGGYYPFVFSDVTGLEPREAGIQTDDLTLILKGHILDGYVFNPWAPITEDHPKYKQNPRLCDKIHCLVSIVPANVISLMDTDVIEKMRRIRKQASRLNIPQVVVLTKVDEACELVRNDLRKIYYSRKIKEKVEKCSSELGISLNSIYPVKNYHAEITQDNDIDVLILMALRDIANFADDYVEDEQEWGTTHRRVQSQKGHTIKVIT